MSFIASLCLYSGKCRKSLLGTFSKSRKRKEKDESILRPVTPVTGSEGPQLTLLPDQDSVETQPKLSKPCGRTGVSHRARSFPPSPQSVLSTMATKGRLDFFVGVVGALLLAHGAFSTIQYRGVLKIREEDFTYPPLQVLVEVALSLVLCLWAALKVPGSFLPILPDAKENRVTKLSANSDFMIFNHRGKIFVPELVEAKFS